MSMIIWNCSGQITPKMPHQNMWAANCLMASSESNLSNHGGM